MKINIDELTFEEIKEVVSSLRRMKMESKFFRIGSTVMLQTESGTVQLPQSEAVNVLGLPALF